MTAEHCDIAIVGAGAAGLAAAIFAGEAEQGRALRIVLLDGARKPGAKILVSGGGRCNVTNETVTPEDYCGGPRHTIRSVLAAFDNRRTVAWMESLGVALKLEPTGKYFPVSDKARTVLDALLARAEALGVELRAGARVQALEPRENAIALRIDGAAPLEARRAIVATGGLSLPKSGSDGWGLEELRRLGHTIVPTTPALVPLVLEAGPMLAGRFADFSGLTLEASIAVRDERGRALAQRAGSLLFTHFGLSGPAALDISRHWLRVRLEAGGATPRATLAFGDLESVAQADEWFRDAAARTPRRRVAAALAEVLPERLAEAIAGDAGTLAQLPRERRRALAESLAALPLPIRGDRGYSFAETTAGGVSLRDIDHRTMRSRVVPNLFLCGELLDVDGRIGGFNFQWAWATGYLAGTAAARD